MIVNRELLKSSTEFDDQSPTSCSFIGFSTLQKIQSALCNLRIRLRKLQSNLLPVDDAFCVSGNGKTRSVIIQSSGWFALSNQVCFDFVGTWSEVVLA